MTSYLCILWAAEPTELFVGGSVKSTAFVKLILWHIAGVACV